MAPIPQHLATYQPKLQDRVHVLNASHGVPVYLQDYTVIILYCLATETHLCVSDLPGLYTGQCMQWRQ